MNLVDSTIDFVDRLQKRWRIAGFSFAVVKKFSDDQASGLAALMAYYAFLSIFPMLLVFITVLGFVLQGNEKLQDSLVNSALVEFPVIGQQLKFDGLTGHWWVLVVSLLISVWGVKGVSMATQDAFNTIWNVPFAQRPGYPAALLRSFGLTAVMGLAVLITGVLSGFGDSGGQNWGLRIGALLLSWLISVGLFILAFRLAIAGEVKTRDLLISATASALLWQVLLALGKLLLEHQVVHAQSLYGVFGVVLGLVAWLHLQAQVTLLAAECDVVRARKLWPRSVSAPPTTRADRRALTGYVTRARRLSVTEQDVHVHFNEAPPGEKQVDESPKPDPVLPT